MNVATATRLIEKAKHTCKIVPRSQETTDRYGNPLDTVGAAGAVVICFFTTPDSLRRGEFFTAEERGSSDIHAMLLPGGVVVGTDDAITDIRYDRGGANETTLIEDTMLLEVMRQDVSLLPFMRTLVLREVR